MTTDSSPQVPSSHPTFTSLEIENFRRQAKRFAKTDGVSHARALDAIANVHGFRNWSLLSQANGQSVKVSSTAALPVVPSAAPPSIES